ncbi:MAG: ribonuclease P protein component [Bacteroidota bacterium]
MKHHGFKKKERIRQKKLIQQLFTEGKAFRLSLLRCYYLPYEGITHQVLFSVPKKIIKKAVVRNALKRRMREAYRLSKHMIGVVETCCATRFCIGYVYVGRGGKKPTYANFLQDIEKSMGRLQALLHSFGQVDA